MKKQDMCTNTPFWKENAHEFSKTEEMMFMQYHTSVAPMDAILRMKSYQCEAEKDDVCQTIGYPFYPEENESWKGSIESILHSPYMDNFRMLCEGSILFGKRGVCRYLDIEYPHMGGVFHDILRHQEQAFSYERDVYSSINAWTAGMRSESHEEIFYVWAGSNVLSWLSKCNYGKTIENIGKLCFVRIETFFGTLMIHRHYFLDIMGMENKVLIYDPTAIELRVRIPLRIRRIPPSADCMVTTFLLEESFSPKIVNKDAIRVVEMKNFCQNHRRCPPVQKRGDLY